MFLVVGLGNPGKEYSLSKHNIGFMVIDEISNRLGVNIGKKGFRSLYTEVIKDEKKLILLKPQTYMNRSGEAVRDAAEFFKIPAENIIVVYDEMDLPSGNIKIKIGGGSAGHKGIESIIVNLGDLGFIRVRVGIGKPLQKSGGASHVLSGFGEEEREIIKDTLTKSADAVLEIIAYGAESAMNKFNRREDLKTAG